VAELAPATQEVADLRVREKDARDDAHETKEKLVALIERACTDAMEAERLQKERDDLLRASEILFLVFIRTPPYDPSHRLATVHSISLRVQLPWSPRTLQGSDQGVSSSL